MCRMETRKMPCSRIHKSMRSLHVDLGRLGRRYHFAKHLTNSNLDSYDIGYNASLGFRCRLPLTVGS